jgi:hypothetical protein
VALRHVVRAVDDEQVDGAGHQPTCPGSARSRAAISRGNSTVTIRQTMS